MKQLAKMTVLHTWILVLRSEPMSSWTRSWPLDAALRFLESQNTSCGSLSVCCPVSDEVWKPLSVVSHTHRSYCVCMKQRSVLSGQSVSPSVTAPSRREDLTHRQITAAAGSNYRQCNQLRSVWHWTYTKPTPKDGSALRRLRINKPASLARAVKLPACTRWFKYDRDWFGLFTHKSVPVIFEPPCIWMTHYSNVDRISHIVTDVSGGFLSTSSHCPILQYKPRPHRFITFRILTIQSCWERR